MTERSVPTSAGGMPRPAVLEGALRTAYETGRGAHARLYVTFEAYAARAGRLAGLPAESAAAVARAAHGDLYLAACCEAGAPGAWESFCGTYRGRLEGLLLARGVDRSEAEALAADLLADLALPPPRAGARTLLGTYDGSGSLFAWLSVILARRRASAAARRPVALPEEPAGSVRAPAGATEPLDALLDGEAAQEFGSAFARAWAGLNERERLLLLLKHRHGVKQADIAALLGIGAPRVSRVLDRAVAKLRKALRRFSTRSERFGGGRPLWEGLRDVVVRHLARMDSLAAPPLAAEHDRKGTP